MVGKSAKFLTQSQLSEDHFYTYLVHPVKAVLEYAQVPNMEAKAPLSLLKVSENIDNYADFIRAAVAFVAKLPGEASHFIELDAGRALLVDKTGASKILSARDFTASKSHITVHGSAEVFKVIHERFALEQFSRTPSVETLNELMPTLVELADQHRVGENPVVIQLPGDQVKVEVAFDRSWKFFREGVNYDSEVPSVDLASLLSEYQREAFAADPLPFSLPGRIPWNDDSLFWFHPSFSLLNEHVVGQLKQEALTHSFATIDALVIRFPASKVGVAFRENGRMDRLETAEALEALAERGSSRVVSLMDLSRRFAYVSKPVPDPPRIVIKEPLPAKLELLSESTIGEMRQQAEPWFGLHPNVWRVVLKLPGGDEGVALTTDGKLLRLHNFQQISNVLQWPDTIEGTWLGNV